MSRPQAWAAVSAGLAVGIGIFAAVPASAEPEPATTTKAAQPNDANSCFGTPDTDISHADAAGAAALRGYVTWYPDGNNSDHGDDEELLVADQKDNGRRYVARFSWCESGEYVTYQRRDSGPDEGPSDYNWYDYNFAEGRKIKFKACEERSSSDRTPISCGPITYANA